MTGARLKRATRYIDDDIFLATYGDGVCNVDINEVIAHHQASGKRGVCSSLDIQDLWEGG